MKNIDVKNKYSNPPNPNGLTPIQRCLHNNLVGSEAWDNLTVGFCRDCGTIIVRQMDPKDYVWRGYYIMPYSVWETITK